MEKDKNGIVYKYPKRSCKLCLKYACLDMTNFKCDFAKYGCKDYIEKDNK